jgi:hypothetical protein
MAMADADELQRLVQDVAREVRWRRVEFWALRGLFVGALAAALPLVFRERLGTMGVLAAIALLVAGALIGALVGACRRVPLTDAARIADRGFGLEERVSTALEWAAHPERPPLVDALVADAIAHVRERPRRAIVTRRWPREARWIPVPIALALALALAPPIPMLRGGLPNFAASTEEEEEKPKERVGRLETDQRPKAKAREETKRAEVQERALAPRQATGGQNQPGDLTAVFKDTSLGARSPDFNSFLKKGDERLKMLGQVDKLPDLQRDFTQSQHKVVFQKAKELRGGLRPDQISPDKLRELLKEMDRLGRKDGGPQGWSGDVGEGMEALERGENDKALEAMEKALSKLRSMEERGRDGKGLRGGRDSDRRGNQRGGREPGPGGPGDEGDFPEGEGSLPGKGKSPSSKGDPSRRLQARPYDVGVEGDSRSGKREGFDTNLLGRGANMPSRLQYLGVIGQYRKMMEEAVAREQVPRDFQDQVKHYFQSLEER